MQFKDILQLMIEASDEATGGDGAEGSPMHQHRSGDIKHKLSTGEVVDNSVSFLVDETSKNTLAHVSYLLAINPDIQKKLQSEIDNYFEEKPVRLIYLITSLLLN